MYSTSNSPARARENTFAWLGQVFLIPVLVGSFANATTISKDIVSNSSWKSSDAGSAGWDTLGFDDGGWTSAYSPYPSPATPEPLVAGTDAVFMWHYPSGSPTGADGTTSAFFRYDFSLELTSGSFPILG